MSKSRKPKGKRKKQQPPPSPKQPKKHLSALSKVFAGILAVATLVGGGAAVVAFLPRVTVDSVGLSDASNPLSALFTVTNTNFIPLEHLGIFVGLCRARISQNVIIQSTAGDCSRPNGALFFHEPWQNHRLAMDERLTVMLKDVFDAPGGPFVGGDISVIVKFRPWILPFERKKEFRFTGERYPDGSFAWHPQSIDHPE